MRRLGTSNRNVVIATAPPQSGVCMDRYIDSDMIETTPSHSYQLMEGRVA